MKKVEKVSIAEISFTLDNDAYVALKQYLSSLNECYSGDPDGAEIVRDIEARIAELILDEQVYTKVVSRPLIETIITQLGTPDQIDGGDGFAGGSNDEKSAGVDADSWNGRGGASGSGGTGGGWMSDGSGGGSIPRRLHRSNEGQIFGGVCSGMAKFLEVNVVWVRLVFLFPLILFMFFAPASFGHSIQEFAQGWLWVFFVTYVVLWIALPMARTPRQKLEARGEKITPASIRQTMQDAATTPAGRKAASVAAEVVNVFGRVVLFFVKLVMAMIGFVLLFTALGVLIGIVAMLVTPTAAMVVNGVSLVSVFAGISILSPALFLTLALLCAFIPLMVTGLALLSFTFSWRLGRVFYGLTLGTWVLAVIFLGIVSASNASFFQHQVRDRIEKWHHENDWDQEQDWESDPDSRSENDGWEVKQNPGPAVEREVGREEWREEEGARNQPGAGDSPQDSLPGAKI